MKSGWKQTTLVSFALTASLSLATVYAQVQPQSAGIYNSSLQSTSSLAQSVNTIVAPYVSNGDFSGVVMLVKHGMVMFNQGYGDANLATKTLNTPNTRFAISALSQTFTAVAVLQLVQKGVINLDSSVRTYLPQLPSSGQNITVRELLAQTSGAPGSSSQQPTAPGTAFQYNPLNYALLGAIIQAASGQSYQSYIQQHILTPLGMTNTGFFNSMSQISNSAVGYTLNSQNQITPYNLQLTNMQDYTDGLYSTVGDLFKWDQALYNGQIVSRQLIEEMFTPSSLSESALKGFGYGFGWGVALDGKSAFGQGAITGYDSYLYRDMGNDESIIILSNRQWAPVGQMAQQLEPVLNQAPIPVPTVNSQVTGQKEIIINGKVFSKPYSRVAFGTTHMPIWYIGKALEQLGAHQTWDPTNRVWNITLPASMKTNFSNIQVGNGNTDIVINGQLVKRVNSYPWLDPGTGYKSYTVYAPIYYIQQILNAAGVQNTWNGNAWIVTH